MKISAVDARSLFTKEVVNVFSDFARPTSFLRSFFRVTQSSTKNVSIEVERNKEAVAVDVVRGTEGNRNTFSKSTEKIITPPYYREYFELTDLDLYDRLFGVGTDSVNAAVFNEFMDAVSRKMDRMVGKIERAAEKQCSDVLHNGILTLADGTTINFKRKTNSVISLGAGQWWTVNGQDPYEDLETGAKFLRTQGKSQGAVINAIMGSKALAAFLNNSEVKTRADIRNFSLDAVRAPQRNSVGAALQGEVTAGSYIIRLWTYPEVYELQNGTLVDYIDPKKVIMIPESTDFNLAYAAVPRLYEEGAGFEQGMYVFDDYKDKRKTSHIMDVKSAFVAIPTAVDQIFTMQVVE